MRKKSLAVLAMGIMLAAVPLWVQAAQVGPETIAEGVNGETQDQSDPGSGSGLPVTSDLSAEEDVTATSLEPEVQSPVSTEDDKEDAAVISLEPEAQNPVSTEDDKKDATAISLEPEAQNPVSTEDDKKDATAISLEPEAQSSVSPENEIAPVSQDSVQGSSESSAEETSASSTPPAEESGWKAEEGGKYYYEQEGERLKGFQQIGDHWYLFDESGCLLTGVQKVKLSESETVEYYFSEEGEDPAAGLGAQKQNCIVALGESLLYFDQSGARVTKDGWVSTDSEHAYYIKDGKVSRGNHTYYLRESGEGTVAWLTLDGDWYLLDGETGERLEGWQVADHVSYYLDPANGGKMATGSKDGGWQDIDGKRYAFYTWGGRRQDGWYLYQDKWYWLDKTTGVMQVGGRVFYDNNWYFFDDKGVMYSNCWVTYENKKYYTWSWGGAKKNEWQQQDGAWYWFKADGTMAQKEWIHHLNRWYYLKEDGRMCASEWLLHEGRWYYFYNWGGMYASEWLYYKGAYYYFYNWGGMYSKEWLRLNGNSYYFYDWGGRYHSGTFTIDGKEYYFDSEGRMRDQSASMDAAKSILDRVGWDLRAAFNWAAGIPYYREVGSVPAGMKNHEYYAQYGFSNSTGDCHVMAATFYKMALLLGYDAHYVEGSVPLRSGGMGPHAWCEIVIGGTTYVFDPNFTNETGRNGYQITYGMSGTWRYSNYARLD